MGGGLAKNAYKNLTVPGMLGVGIHDKKKIQVAGNTEGLQPQQTGLALPVLSNKNSSGLGTTLLN